MINTVIKRYIKLPYMKNLPNVKKTPNKLNAKEYISKSLKTDQFHLFEAITTGIVEEKVVRNIKNSSLSTKSNILLGR